MNNDVITFLLLCIVLTFAVIGIVTVFDTHTDTPYEYDYSFYNKDRQIIETVSCIYPNKTKYSFTINRDDNIIPTININHNCTHNIYVEYNYDDFIIKGSD